MSRASQCTVCRCRASVHVTSMAKTTVMPQFHEFASKDMCAPGPITNEHLFDKNDPQKLRKNLRPGVACSIGRPPCLCGLRRLQAEAGLHRSKCSRLVAGLSDQTT